MSSRALLEAAIEADPYDRQAYAVLADHLQELGDPRGELIALQLAGTNDAAAAAIIASLGQPPGVTFHYEHGYVRSAVVDPGTAKGTRDVLEHPSCRFLVELTVGHNNAPLTGTIKAIGSALRPTLRILRLGNDKNVEVYAGLMREIGDMSAMWAALPRLEELRLLGQRGELGEIEAPVLKSFELRSSVLSTAMASSLATARWPALERLTVFCATQSTKAEPKARRGLAELFARGDMPALRELHVEHLPDADKLLAILATSPLLPRLTSLQISNSGLTDTGAQTILANPAAFAHLTTFNLQWNDIKDERLETLLQHVPGLEADLQSYAEDDEHYEDADE